MADLIFLPRALSATGAVVPDATAYFFEAGTSTPLTVYEGSDLLTPRGTSVAADAEGAFPQCWIASGTAVKVDIRNGSGVSLPGYEQDNAGRFPESASDAANVAVTPVTGNPATDLQAGYANNVGRINKLDNAAALPTSTGSSAAYTLTSAYTITAYAARQEYEFRAHQASAGADTLNVDGVGAVTLKKIDATNAKVDLAAGDIAIGDVVRVKHDGTHFVIVGNRAAPLDEDDMASNNPFRAPSQQSVAAYVGLVHIATQSGNQAAAIDFGSAHFDAAKFCGYRWVCELDPASSAAIWLRLSGDGASTFRTADYKYLNVETLLAAAATETKVASNAASSIVITQGSRDEAKFVVEAASPDDASAVSRNYLNFHGMCEIDGVGSSYHIFGSGSHAASSTFNGIRFMASTGNISGRVAMFGYPRL